MVWMAKDPPAPPAEYVLYHDLNDSGCWWQILGGGYFDQPFALQQDLREVGIAISEFEAAQVRRAEMEAKRRENQPEWMKS